jgi:hypothetical protein
MKRLWSFCTTTTITTTAAATATTASSEVFVLEGREDAQSIARYWIYVSVRREHQVFGMNLKFLRTQKGSTDFSFFIMSVSTQLLSHLKPASAETSRYGFGVKGHRKGDVLH